VALTGEGGAEGDQRHRQPDDLDSGERVSGDDVERGEQRPGQPEDHRGDEQHRTAPLGMTGRAGDAVEAGAAGASGVQLRPQAEQHHRARPRTASARAAPS
jgi:hypothetical protein